MQNDAITSIRLLAKLRMSSQKAMAKEAGMTPEKMSRILNHQVELPASTIRSLAAATKYPEEFFTHGYRELSPLSLTYRHVSRVPVKRLNAISAEYSVLSGFSYRIWKHLRATWKTSWIDQIAIRAKRITPEEIDSLADECRKAMKIPAYGPVGNVINAAERSGIIVAPLISLQKDGSKAHLNSDGITCPVLPDGYAPAIGYSKEMTGDRLRFTIAHEIGHLVLHKYRKPQHYSDMEAEAHRFASAFLMPADDARKVINQYTFLSEFLPLKAKWGMSIAALITRGYNINAYGKDRWRSLFMQLSARHWRFNEPITVECEHPILLKEMLLRLYGEDNVIDTKAIEIDTGIPIKLISEWAPGLQYHKIMNIDIF